MSNLAKVIIKDWVEVVEGRIVFKKDTPKTILEFYKGWEKAKQLTLSL